MTDPTIRIAGSLWSVATKDLETEAVRLTRAGLDLWHWDYADGTLGPRGGFGPEAARALAVLTGARSEAHLMAADPRAAIAGWAEFAELIVVHRESPHWEESLRLIRAAGVRPGLALSPDETVDGIGLDEDVAVLVMTVHPGRAGSGFLDSRLDILPLLKDQPMRGIDGSADRARAAKAVGRGANWIVSGTALTSSADPAKWLQEVRAAAG